MFPEGHSFELCVCETNSLFKKVSHNQEIAISGFADGLCISSGLCISILYTQRPLSPQEFQQLLKSATNCESAVVNKL